MTIQRNLNADLEKLAAAFYRHLRVDDCEYGSLGVDPKRPFGNSDVNGDILEIIGWEREGNDGEDSCYATYQRQYARDLYHKHLITYLQLQWSNGANLNLMRAAAREAEGQ